MIFRSSLRDDLKIISSIHFIRSSLRDDLIKWVGCSSVRLLTIVFFYLLRYYATQEVETSESDTRHLRRVAQSLILRFPPRGRAFEILNFYPLPCNEAVRVELCRMIIDVGAHSRSVPDFAISSQVALWGARILKSTVLIRLS